MLKDQRCIGYAEYYVVLDECHLLALAVHPDFQQQGYGRALLDVVLREAESAGCTQCLLEVRADNAAAVTLYVRAGFELHGRRTGYYPAVTPAGLAQDALLYSRVLSVV